MSLFEPGAVSRPGEVFLTPIDVSRRADKISQPFHLRPHMTLATPPYNMIDPFSKRNVSGQSWDVLYTTS